MIDGAHATLDWKTNPRLFVQVVKMGFVGLKFNGILLGFAENLQLAKSVGLKSIRDTQQYHTTSRIVACAFIFVIRITVLALT